ncbi:recombinase family protein [Sphingomonas melonis]|uniref:recombinase family protein n=1 Tax=Sphingomonas melonis TaxID=152682 RepID=UPI0035C8736E
MCKVVAYYRVSTEGQGRSGLGLEAQKDAVGTLCRSRGWNIVAEFTEVESGKRDDRPELERAMHRAKVTGGVLVIAKLDRLSRSAAMVTRLQEEGTRFIAANMPEACELTVGMLAVVAREERKAISERTKAALAAAKARGVKLGNPNGTAALQRAGKGNGAAVAAIRADAQERATDLSPIISDIRASGATSLPAIARELNGRGIVTPRGGAWHPSSVRNLLVRLEAAR